MSGWIATLPSARSSLCAAALGVLLAACGGGADVDTPADPVEAREQASEFFPASSIPADANLRGMWSPVYNWPLVSVHALLMPDGRVLTYGSNGDGTQTGRFIYDIWDGSGAPDVGHSTFTNTSGTDLFCSSQLVLPQTGDIFIAGGDNWTGTTTTNTGNNNSNIITAATNAIRRGPNMNRARWYSTATTLLNGEIYIQGGTGGTDRPEVRQLDGSFRLLSTAPTSTLDAYYPRNWVAPDGRVFGYDSLGWMYYVDPAGTGSITPISQFAAAYRGADASAAMFRPGRILQFGGNSNGAIVIDINGPTPVVTPTQSLSSQRRLVNATLLADGQVLATGGSQVYNQLIGVNNTAEIWNPQTGQWLRGAVASQARLYHGNALLLPDASVLITGSGAPSPATQLNAEIYYPPYLFTTGGRRAVRPSITTAPNAISIGKTFSVDVDSASAISRVTLVKTGSTTHSFNMEQRFQDLTFTARGNRLSVQAPTRAVDATPGWYLMFVIDAAGVPSVASMLRIGVAENANPAIVPVLAPSPTQTSTAGTADALQLVASDPNGDPLSYSATGLPAGLTINAATGRIGGVPSAAGSFNVVVSVTDGVNVASDNFLWTVEPALGPLAFTEVPIPSAASTAGQVTYTASATGVNVRYCWNFGNGAPPTDWSASPTVSYTYPEPGIFSVTVSVTDDRGLLESRSFLQVVHLPLTAGRPSASGNLLFETPATGAPRLWVINQDNAYLLGYSSQFYFCT